MRVAPSSNEEPLVAHTVKSLPAVQETQVRSLGREDPLEKEMATHSSVLDWEIPWTEEPGGLQVHGVARVRHDSATKPPIPSMRMVVHDNNIFHLSYKFIWKSRTQ